MKRKLSVPYEKIANLSDKEWLEYVHGEIDRSRLLGDVLETRYIYVTYTSKGKEIVTGAVEQVQPDMMYINVKNAVDEHVRVHIPCCIHDVIASDCYVIFNPKSKNNSLTAKSGSKFVYAQFSGILNLAGTQGVDLRACGNSEHELNVLDVRYSLATEANNCIFRRAFNYVTHDSKEAYNLFKTMLSMDSSVKWYNKLKEASSKELIRVKVDGVSKGISIGDCSFDKYFNMLMSNADFVVQLYKIFGHYGSPLWVSQD